MTTKLYIGGLAWATTDESLRAHFASAGEIVSAKVVMERDNPNRSRGFGFVEMATEEAGDAALKLDGSELDGRNIRVSPQQDRAPGEDRPARSFGGGAGRSFGGGGGGNRGGSRSGGGYSRGGSGRYSSDNDNGYSGSTQSF